MKIGRVNILGSLPPLLREKAAARHANIQFIFNFVRETSSWAYFKDNIVLNKKIKIYMVLKLIFFIVAAFLIH